LHDIEPHFKWRDHYVASEDARSPFYGRVYDEFRFTNKIYNYFIHPQWDHFGSETLYMKILFVDYIEGFAIIELIGEWNDCLKNDIMFLKREIVDHMRAEAEINQFILIGENVLNFHGDDDAYYEEWYEDIVEEQGWICLLNLQAHVEQEMKATQLHFYLNFGDAFNELNWRLQKPVNLYKMINQMIHQGIKKLPY